MGNVKLADYAAAQEIQDLVNSVSRKNAEFWTKSHYGKAKDVELR